MRAKIVRIVSNSMTFREKKLQRYRSISFSHSPFFSPLYILDFIRYRHCFDVNATAAVQQISMFTTSTSLLPSIDRTFICRSKSRSAKCQNIHVEYRALTFDLYIDTSLEKAYIPRPYIMRYTRYSASRQ